MRSDGLERPRPHLTRRQTIAALGTSFAGLTGCLSGPSFPDADVIAGPDNRNAFEPTELTVSVGTTVRWGFASGGHNVCCRPEHSDDVALPASADPFASFGPEESAEATLVPRGETYEQTLTEVGTYRYVCVPHDGMGMVGTVTVD